MTRISQWAITASSYSDLPAIETVVAHSPSKQLLHPHDFRLTLFPGPDNIRFQCLSLHRNAAAAAHQESLQPAS